MSGARRRSRSPAARPVSGTRRVPGPRDDRRSRRYPPPRDLRERRAPRRSTDTDRAPTRAVADRSSRLAFCNAPGCRISGPRRVAYFTPRATGHTAPDGADFGSPESRTSDEDRQCRGCWGLPVDKSAPGQIGESPCCAGKPDGCGRRSCCLSTVVGVVHRSTFGGRKRRCAPVVLKVGEGPARGRCCSSNAARPPSPPGRSARQPYWRASAGSDTCRNTAAGTRRHAGRPWTTSSRMSSRMTVCPYREAL